MSADHLPATAIDIYRMLPEGTRCEVIYNELTMSPSPTSEHQLLLMTLSGKLYYFLDQNNNGKVIPSPMDVYLEGYLSVVQPDILVVLKEQEHTIKPDGVYGAPGIVIEILSASNRVHDTQKKKTLYEKAGVKEYFIVDPATKDVILYSLSRNGVYRTNYHERKVLKSALLGCSIDF